MSTLNYAEVRGKDFGTMTHAEARLVIIREVGLNKSPRSVFGKADLNAIHRYLTGSYYFPKSAYYTPDSPETGEIRQAIAQEADLDYDPGDDFNRPFVLRNVQNLARTVKKSKDRRH